DTPMMSGDRGVDQLAAMGFERRQRAHFIDAHQPAVADDIRSQNGHKLALGGLSFHERLPPASYSVRRRDYLPLAVGGQSVPTLRTSSMGLLWRCLSAARSRSQATGKPCPFPTKR